MFDAAALMLDLPTPVLVTDPVAATDPLAAPEAPNSLEKPEGKDCVGTLNGSEPVPVVDAV